MIKINNNKFHILFRTSNKYIYVKIINFNSGSHILSVSTASVLFKELKNKRGIIASRLLGILCRKIINYKSLSINNYYKNEAKFSSRNKVFINALIN